MSRKTRQKQRRSARQRERLAKTPPVVKAATVQQGAQVREESNA
jgi:hypothetical protein